MSLWKNLESEFVYYASLAVRTEKAMDALKIITASRAMLDWMKTLSSYAEDIKDTQKRGEFMMMIGKLQIELGETNIKLSMQVQENYDLQNRIEALQEENKDLKNPKLQLVFKNGFYYKQDDDSPFCPGCYDDQKKSIRLTPTSPLVKQHAGEKYKCPICKVSYS